MDEPQKRDADRPTQDAAHSSDLVIYVLALLATIVIVVGLLAWVQIDPFVPAVAPARESGPTLR